MCSLPYPTMVIYYCFFQATRPAMIRKEPGATKTRSDPVVLTSLTRQCVQCLVQAFPLSFSYPVVCTVLWKQSKLMDQCVVAHSTKNVIFEWYETGWWCWNSFLWEFSKEFVSFRQTAVCTTVSEYVQNKRKREMKFFFPKMWCTPSCKGMWWEISHTETP